MPLRAPIGPFGGEKSRPASGEFAPTIAAGVGDKIAETSGDLKAPDADTNATADVGKFDALFDEQLPLIVRGLMPQSAALGVRQNAAFSTLIDASQTRGFIQYAKDRLWGLTAGECMRLQLPVAGSIIECARGRRIGVVDTGARASPLTSSMRTRSVVWGVA
jgi:hypothetical protein